MWLRPQYCTLVKKKKKKNAAFGESVKKKKNLFLSVLMQRPGLFPHPSSLIYNCDFIAVYLFFIALT